MASLPDSPLAQPAAPPPPPPGDRPGEYPRWPLWAPLLAVALGLAVAILGLGIGVAALEAAGVGLNEDTPGFTAVSTLIIDLAIVAASIGVAAMTVRPRAWHFGFRRAPLGSTLGVAAIAVLAFFAFEIVYGAIFEPENPQTVVRDLGANESTLLLVSGALVVILVAPVCEELFFRGFLFRVLRARMNFWLAAAIDGLLFGLVHGSLVIVPVLLVLGIALCWVYERTGTLFAPIAIHALNNTLAYGVSTEDGWAAAGAVGASVIAATLVAPLLFGRRSPAASV